MYDLLKPDAFIFKLEPDKLKQLREAPKVKCSKVSAVCWDYIKSYDDEEELMLSSLCDYYIRLPRRPKTEEEYKDMIYTFFREAELPYLATEVVHPFCDLQRLLEDFHEDYNSDDLLYTDPSKEIEELVEQLNMKLADEFGGYNPLLQYIEPDDIARLFLHVFPFDALSKHLKEGDFYFVYT
jgi:hypothetical protein